MSDALLAPSTLLFRFACPCNQTDQVWSTAGFELSNEYRLPHFGNMDGQASFADVRAAWSAAGLFFDVEVFNKHQSLWCRPTQMLESDRVMFWIDTRDMHGVHRATRFCHWFLVMPIGGGSDGKQPQATMLKINRSKEDSPTLNQYRQLAATRITPDGYRLLVHLPKSCLNGWNPNEHRRLGFNYAIKDRELGFQTLAVGPELPIEENPSLWQTLELAKASTESSAK